MSYELTSMVSMTLLLNRQPANGDVHNALLEGTLLHARNLLDFLGPWKHLKDDIVPEDFVAGWDPSHLHVADATRTAINKHLAHLTWTRVHEGKVMWEFPGVAAAVFEAFGKFVEHCEANDAAQAGTFRLNYDLAMATIRAMVPTANDEISPRRRTRTRSSSMSSVRRQPRPTCRQRLRPGS